jgi:hypothetical protein
MRHRAIRVEPGRFLKRSNRTPVIEPEDELQSLIEKLLGVRRRRGDLVMVITEPFLEWFGGANGRGGQKQNQHLDR